MTAIRIIGVGSPFGQDQLGWQAAEALQASGLAQRYAEGRVSIQCSDRPGASLLVQMRGADCVLIIDALQSGATPGTIRCLGEQELATTPGFFSSHDFGVVAALALGRVLGELLARVRILGIEMDPAAADTAPLPTMLLRQLEEIIATEINNYGDNDNADFK